MANSISAVIKALRRLGSLGKEDTESQQFRRKMVLVRYVFGIILLLLAVPEALPWVFENPENGVVAGTYAMLVVTAIATLLLLIIFEWSKQSLPEARSKERKAFVSSSLYSSASNDEPETPEIASTGSNSGEEMRTNWCSIETNSGYYWGEITINDKETDIDIAICPGLSKLSERQYKAS